MKKVVKIRVAIFLLIVGVGCILATTLFDTYISIDIETNSQIELNVFYDNGKTDGYCFDDSHLSETHIVPVGRHTISVKIPKEAMNRLRIDFGTHPCTVQLREIAFVSSLTKVQYLLAEDIYREFDELNNISEASVFDGIVKYTIDGTDGFIATEKSIVATKSHIFPREMVISAVVIIAAAFLICFGKCLLSRVSELLVGLKKKNIRILPAVLVVVLGVWLGFRYQKYLLLTTLFAVMVGSSLSFLIIYLWKYKRLYKEYLLISGLTIVSMFPFLLNGFYYGDMYWDHSNNRTAVEHLIGGIGAKRPFIGVISSFATGTSVDSSNIKAVCI